MRYRRENKKQIAVYLSMLEYAAITDRKQRTNNAKNIEKMSENTNKSGKAVNTTTETENAAKTAENTATNGNGFSFANSFNKVTFNIDVTDFEYCKLAALYNAEAPNTVYKLDGIWVNKSPLGESPVFIVSELGKLVNMPMHLTATVREILNNSDAVNAIRNGKVGFTVYEYESHARKCYNVRFADI